MPIRSSNSSVLKWPDAQRVHESVRRWGEDAARKRSGVLRVGYFGSYARGDWGVGSDVDLVMVVDRSDLPFERRAIEWDTTRLPVPADLLVYTQDEWNALTGRFRETVDRDAIWVYGDAR